MKIGVVLGLSEFGARSTIYKRGESQSKRSGFS